MRAKGDFARREYQEVSEKDAKVQEGANTIGNSR
jgi:hypothetical protein